MNLHSINQIKLEIFASVALTQNIINITDVNISSLCFLSTATAVILEDICAHIAVCLTSLKFSVVMYGV